MRHNHCNKASTSSLDVTIPHIQKMGFSWRIFSQKTTGLNFQKRDFS